MVAGIGGEVRSVQMRESDDSRRGSSPQQTSVGKVVEEVPAQLLVEAMRQWRPEATAIDGGAIA